PTDSTFPFPLTGEAAMLSKLCVSFALVLALTLSTSADDKTKEKPGEGYVKVEVKGKVQTGIVAIGGETTGMTITARPGLAWALDAGTNKELREQLEKLNGKMAVVKGELTTREGGTIRRVRVIVKVTAGKGGEA